MADRRMFSKAVVESDVFLDMPITARALYFHLGMQADDDGFINSPKKVQRMAGCSDDDMKLLIAKRFLIPFETGVLLIRHWNQNNWIRPDRHKPTVCQSEIAMVTIDKAGQYELGTQPDNQLSTSCQPTDNQVVGKRLHSIEEYKEYSLVKTSIKESPPPPTAEEALKTIEAYASNTLVGFNGAVFQEFGDFKAKFPENMIRFAISEASAHGKPYWAYVRKILQRWQVEHITTLEQAKLNAEERTKSMDKPKVKWLD